MNPTKEYLRTIRNLDLTIESMTDREAEIWTELTRITVAPDKEAVDGGTLNMRKEELLDQLSELQNAIEDKRFQALQERSKIALEIAQVRDARFHWILKSLYLDWKKYQRLDDLKNIPPFYFEYSTLCEYHGKALIEFQNNLDKPS